MPIIQCPCGKQIRVEEVQAGSALRCDCGRQLVIPNMRALRQHAARGEPAPAATPYEPAEMTRQRPPELLFLLTDHENLVHRISLEALSALHFRLLSFYRTLF